MLTVETARIRTVAEFLEAEGLESTHCGDETGFSWWSCDCCESELGGTRHQAVGYAIKRKRNGRIRVVDGYRVCDDCLFAIAYGEEES